MHFVRLLGGNPSALSDVNFGTAAATVPSGGRAIGPLQQRNIGGRRADIRPVAACHEQPTLRQCEGYLHFRPYRTPLPARFTEPLLQDDPPGRGHMTQSRLKTRPAGHYVQAFGARPGIWCAKKGRVRASLICKQTAPTARRRWPTSPPRAGCGSAPPLRPIDQDERDGEVGRKKGRRMGDIMIGGVRL